jgi:hypothetical protein
LVVAGGTRIWVFQSELQKAQFLVNSVPALILAFMQTFGRPSGMCGVNLSQIPLPLNIDDDVSDVSGLNLMES